MKIGKYSICYKDAQSLYMQYKDIFVHGIYDFDSFRNKPDSFRNKPVIIDGGGCIGMSMLRFKQRYPDSKILCFEPDCELCDVISINLDENYITNVSLVNAGLAGKDGFAYFDANGTDSGKLSPDGKIEIKTVRLSNYIDEPIEFLKLNIEGTELEVLQDLEASGKLHFVEEMVIEYHGFAGTDQKLSTILAILERNGYRYMLHDFDNETQPATKPPFKLMKSTTWFVLLYARKRE